MATHSPLAGQWASVTLVSGPRNVRNVRPSCRVTTISMWLAATERNVPARSLWHRHTRSTNGESDSLASSKTMNIRQLLLGPHTPT
jgi:hypothetical protein